MMTYREFIEKAAPGRAILDRYLDPSSRMWAKFDPEIGYTLRNAWIRDGVDGAYTLSRYAEDGPRRQGNFADQPCRINTYGNSFTQCHQVSDGETWQEILAAHFCEPIRNYGIGGHGVYQAYRRLLRNEATDDGAPYVIFNLWGDDHQRSITPWRWFSFAHAWDQATTAFMFHGNPWAYARLDPDSGELIEIPTAFGTPESLYQLCDPAFTYETFKDDFVIRIQAVLRDDVEVDPAPLRAVAESIGLGRLKWDTPEAAAGGAWTLYNEYAWKVSVKIMDKVKAWADGQGKQLLILLSYPEASIREICEGKSRDAEDYLDWHPRALREHIAGLGLPCLDILPKHVEEFKTFRLSPKEYVGRYYIGHYNPRGNHFFAYAIKDALVDWLDPKPPAYRGDEEPLIRFRGYLPG